MKQDFTQAKKHLDIAFLICDNDKNLSYETAEKFKENLKDIKNMITKCEAKI